MDLVGRAKEKWTMDAEDAGIKRNLFVLQDMQPSVFEIFLRDLAYCRRRSHIPDVDQNRQDHPHLHGHGKVRENSQEEGDEPDCDFEFAQTE